MKDVQINEKKIGEILNSDNEKKIKPLNELTIKEYKYKFKDVTKKGYCYRCIHCANCKLTIFIEFEEYKKILNDINEKETIKFTINSKQQNHTCLVINKK